MMKLTGLDKAYIEFCIWRSKPMKTITKNLEEWNKIFNKLDKQTKRIKASLKLHNKVFVEGESKYLFWRDDESNN